MNIMIPMAGSGSRFSAAGYRTPKPMIPIIARPMLFWILDNLKFKPLDTLWLGIQQDVAQKYAIEDRVHKEYPSLHFRVVSVDFQTRGAAETLFVMLQHMSSEEIRRKSISLDCDTIFFSDVLGDFRSCPSDYGSSFYFEDEGNKPIYSYICFKRGTHEINDIQEKVAISRHANTGAYAFPCGERLRNACRDILDHPVGSSGEFYVSGVIKAMMRTGQGFLGIHVRASYCVGTPGHLRSFLRLIRDGEIVPRFKARIYFDLDRSLVVNFSAVCVNGRCAKVQPVEANIRLLQELKCAGHCIIVETYRTKLPEKEGCKSRVLSGPGSLTFERLKRFGIYFDEIKLGKNAPRELADEMIGGAHGSLEKEVGWYLESPESKRSAAAGVIEGFISPRFFNRITLKDAEHVVKTGPEEYLRGELHFYRSIPPELAHLFPRLIEASDKLTPGLPSLTITKIDGVSFSTLVTNHCVTRGRFAKLLQRLSSIHTAAKSSKRGHDVISASSAMRGAGKLLWGGAVAPASEPMERVSPERSPEKLPPSSICANLHEKVSHRLRMNEAVYAKFDAVDVQRMSQTILKYLRDYQDAGSFSPADYVHGDPVFSNCLLNKAGEIKFIDMRGALGDMLCTEGDINYDLSKVYQSLCGYDFMIMDKNLDHIALGVLRDLEENVFWPFVKERYPEVDAEDIAMLAASHFLSIVPLHDERRHQARFLKACKRLLGMHPCFPATSEINKGGC